MGDSMLANRSEYRGTCWSCSIVMRLQPFYVHVVFIDGNMHRPKRVMVGRYLQRSTTYFG
jgi:hypothetical protein